MKVTMSGMHRAEACPASTFLPRVEESGESAARGSAIHAYLAAMAEIDPEKALAAVPEEFRLECACIDLSRMPHVRGDAWAFEVGLAWDWEADVGRELFRGSDARNYSSVGSTELPGTADVIGVTGDDEVVVLDIKTGWSRLSPPESAPQLLGYAVAAARAYGRSEAIVGWIRVVNETPRFEVARLDALQLDMAADRLRAVIEAAQGAEILHQTDPSLTVPRLGPHCRYCPSWRACPANIGLMRELVASPDATPDIPVLDAQTAPLVWVRLEAAERVLAATRRAIEEYAKAHPIDLPDGDKVGLVKSTREKIDPLMARGALGEELFEAAVELKTEITKESLKKAIKARLTPGQKLAPAERVVFERLRKASAISTSEFSTVKRFTQKKPAESEGDETP